MRNKSVFITLLIGLGLLVSVPANSDDALSTAYNQTLKDVSTARSRYSRDHRIISTTANTSFVPANCSVESWCLVKATECFLGRYSRPSGLWMGHAQYSVVRRAVALCPVRYGDWQRRIFTGPVEPIRFRSDQETTKKTAGEVAENLCLKYRTDWVSAAPSCDNQCR